MPLRRSVSLALDGLAVRRHEVAVEKLESIANSFFFEVESVYRVPLTLRRALPRRRAGGAPSRPRRPRPTLTFPRSSYDPEAMALYWYARSAVGMPLLQFLAFYQAIEFYFGRYAEAELRKRLSDVAKDPAFDPHDPREVGRLISAMVLDGVRLETSGHSSVRCFGNASARKNFAISTKLTSRQKEFFSKKQAGLTAVRIPLASSTQDLRQ